MCIKNLLTTKETARFLGMSEAFLLRDRWAGAKIPFIKIGKRAVRYRMEDSLSYLEQKKLPETDEREDIE